MDVGSRGARPPAERRAGEAMPGMASAFLSGDDALALLAHDFRSELTVARGFALTLLQHGPRMSAEDVQRGLAAVVRHTDALLELVEGILETARAESGKLELDVRPVAADELIGEAERRARERHPRHEIRRVGATAVHVPADARRIEQVLGNLVSNAAKSAPSGSQIGLRASRVAAGVEFGVVNDGPAIAPAQRAVLFEKFGTRGASVGLGLYLCRLIVEAHGGWIWMTRRRGRTEFRFLLPSA